MWSHNTSAYVNNLEILQFDVRLCRWSRWTTKRKPRWPGAMPAATGPPGRRGRERGHSDRRRAAAAIGCVTIR